MPAVDRCSGVSDVISLINKEVRKVGTFAVHARGSGYYLFAVAAAVQSSSLRFAVELPKRRNVRTSQRGAPSFLASVASMQLPC